MSFLKIKDPVKRDQIVKEYLTTKKRIRDSLLAEKTGDIELQSDLSKFFRPITKSQKDVQEEATKKITESQLATSRGIIAGLEPIRKGVLQIPGAITEGLSPIREGIIQLPVQLSKEMKTRQLRMETPPPSYQKITVEENEEKIKNFVKVFNEKLIKYKYNFDEIYRIVFDSDLEKFKFGNKVISYNPNDNFFSFEGIGSKIPATDGLWELILSNNPKNYDNKKDLNIYQYMLYSSDILFKGNDRKNELKDYNVLGEKWKKIVEPVFNQLIKTAKGLRKKKTTTVIPSDPNALLKRLDLLMASKEAGNTGVSL